MKKQELANNCLNSLKDKGIEKAGFHLNKSKRYEMNLFGGEITLLRTTFDNDLAMIAINQGQKGLISLNKTDAEALSDAVDNVIEMSQNAESDPANDVSPMQPELDVHSGDTEPDLEAMHQGLTAYLKAVAERYPKIKLMDSALDFTVREDYYSNSNGVKLSAQKGSYTFATTFAAQDGEKSSSFNYSAITMNKLDKPLIDCGTIDMLLKQSVEQLDTTPIEGKFVGDVILTPDCLTEILEAYLSTYLRDMALISGTSLLKDKLNQKIASDKLTIHSNPVSEEIPGGYYITSDGFEAKNLTIVENGVLKSFLLSLYGANKTGRQRSLNPGGTYIVNAGEKSFDDMVKSIKRGILVARFSGGNPSKSGDFSGIAKNSYYIEDGKIMYPVSETMIAGNLLELFSNIIDISREQIHFGHAVLPWISASGVTISGK